MAFKAKIGEQEFEVEEIPGWVPEERVREEYVPKKTFSAELDRRATSIIKNKGLRAPDELLDDEEFRAKFIERHGLDPSKGAKDFQEQLTRERESLMNREVKPREEKLGKLTERLQRKINRELEAEIMQAAANVPTLRRSLLRATAQGAPAPIVSLLREAFGYSEEHDRWFAKGKDGFAYPKGGDDPYKSVAEMVAEWAADPANADWHDSQRQAGPEARPANGVGGAGAVTISREDAKDPAKYRKAKADAEKRGVELKIT
jgi:hypothetical protein